MSGLGLDSEGRIWDFTRKALGRPARFERAAIQTARAVPEFVLRAVGGCGDV